MDMGQDPEFYGKKFLIPFLASIDWEKIDLETGRELLGSINAASYKAAPAIRRRQEAMKEKFQCAWCQRPIEDGKWWNRTQIPDYDTGTQTAICFDSNACYLMYWKGDPSKQRAVLART